MENISGIPTNYNSNEFHNLDLKQLIKKSLGEFEVPKLKTYSLYHENLFIQKVNDMIAQVLENFFSVSDIMEAVRGRFHFYGMNGI